MFESVTFLKPQNNVEDGVDCVNERRRECFACWPIGDDIFPGMKLARQTMALRNTFRQTSPSGDAQVILGCQSPH